MRTHRAWSRRLAGIIISVMMLAAYLPPLAASGAASAWKLDSRYAQRPEHAATGVAGPTRLQEPGRVVARWSPAVPQEQIAAAARRIGFKVLRQSEKMGWVLIEPTRDTLTPEELAAALTRSRLAVRARAERIFRPMIEGPSMPDDPLFAQQWALHNVGQTGGRHDADIDAPEAWESHGSGSSSVVVAVVDTGVYIAHEDLKDNIWRNPGEIPGNRRDDDRNGYIDDINGFDFYAFDSTVYDPEDGDQHGTHVAGIIGAVGDNGTGIAGVNHDVTIMPVKFLGPWGGGEYEGAEAIIYAVDNGAQVINCSWGGPRSEVIEEALQYAAEHGVVVSVAAGNDSSDIDEHGEWSYPASSDATCVITVASTDHDDELSWFSNFGDETVELAAPGEEVTSTLSYESVGVFVNDVPFKVAYLAFCLEAIEPVSSARQALITSLGQLGATTGTRILVVDDSKPNMMGETPGERLSFYTDALAEAGYTAVSTWSTEGRGTPPASVMQGKVVVWFTGGLPAGWYAANTLDAQDRAAIARYLDNGGRLLLASGEAGADVYWSDQDWLLEYLHAYPIDWATWAYTLRGKPRTVYAGITGTLKDAYTSWFEGLWPTGSDPIVPADDHATVIFEMGGYGPLSGTSMAAPHVSGAAAHILASAPGTPADEVKARIENTVDPIASLEGKVSSRGRLNLSRVFDSYPGRPTIMAPRPGDILRAGTDSEVRWLPAAGGSSEATFEAEIGLPQVVYEEGFEDGDIDGWEIVEGSWETTGYAHSGDYAMWSGDLTPDGFAAVATTISVPAGGGTLSWWARVTAGVWGTVMIDETFYHEMPHEEGFSSGSVELGPGFHQVVLYGWMDPEAPDTDADFLAIDDIVLTSHQYTPLGTAAAGEHSVDFTVPDVDTRDARFRVRANLEGVSSGWAYVRGVEITSDFTGPAAPTDFVATNGMDGDALLSWTDPPDADFAYTRILRREGEDPIGPDDPDATVVYEGTDSEFHDTGIADGTELHYAAFAVDENRNWSDGAYATVMVTDEIAPDPVQFVEAAMRDGAVVVSWMNPPAWQIAGVRVLRRTDTTPTAFDDPDATRVFDGVGASARDFDAMLLPDGTRVYYAVFAYDASGHASEPAATSIVVDTKAPEGTIRFDGLDLKTSAVSGEDMYFTASRDVTLVSDVSGATEMRLDTGDGWSDWEPFTVARELTLVDVDGPTIVLAQYRDDAGNLLECSALVYHDKRTPDVPTGVDVFNVNYGAKLVWDLPDDESIVGWNVYVATAPGGLWSRANEDGPVTEPSLYLRGLEAGIEHFFKVTAVDGVGRESAPSDLVSTVPGEGVARLYGATRYQTAIEVSRASFESADTVVLVSGAAFPDALSASALAGVYDAPILLTEPTRLTPGVADEISRLGASHVVIVGGPGAVSDAVKSALPSGLTVERIGGRDRFETSARVAARVVQEMGVDFCREAFIVNGYTFADPLSVSPYAWSRKMPVLLVRYDTASSSVAGFLADYIDSLYIVGGTGVVSEWLADDLGYPDSQRLAGLNRYETAAAAAEFAWEQGWASYGVTGIASGRNFPDALAGAPAIGKAGGVMMLTDPSWLSPATEGALLAHLDEVEKIQILGGPGAVSDGVASYLKGLVTGF